jgi:hypothetical protein
VIFAIFVPQEGSWVEYPAGQKKSMHGIVGLREVDWVDAESPQAAMAWAKSKRYHAPILEAQPQTTIVNLPRRIH